MTSLSERCDRVLENLDAFVIGDVAGLLEECATALRDKPSKLTVSDNLVELSCAKCNITTKFSLEQQNG